MLRKVGTSLLLLFCAVAARAAILDVTIINATFSATCIGGGSTCTEVVNGSVFFDTVAGTAFNVSLHLTGTLNASLNSYVPNGSPGPACVSPLCLQGGGFFYDTGALAGHDPIEFGPALSTLSAPTPVPLVGGPQGTAFFVPALCGGDQPLCNAVGSFPGGAFNLRSGTYTSVDVTSSIPEPSVSILILTGIALLKWRGRRA